MAKKTTKKDGRQKASKAPREEIQALVNSLGKQASEEDLKKLWNETGRQSPELTGKQYDDPEEFPRLFLDVTGKRPVVSLGATAESLYGIKDDCCDVPRLLKAILDELIARRA